MVREDLEGIEVGNISWPVRSIVCFGICVLVGGILATYATTLLEVWDTTNTDVDSAPNDIALLKAIFPQNPDL